LQLRSGLAQALLDKVTSKDNRLVAVAEGYWLLLTSLPVGKHAIHSRVQGTDPDTGAPHKTEWTFNLITQNPNEPIQ
jgi:hypothetical protein